MRALATILVTFLVQCAYLRAEPKPGIREDIGDFLNSDSCIFGVKSVSLYLYNSTCKGNVISQEEICNSVDPSSERIAFLTHGFISSANSSNMKELALQLAQKSYTVFAIDWSQGACTDGIPIAKLMEYPAAVLNLHEVAQKIACYIETLTKCPDRGVPLKNITLIGHSLGAHVSGFAAKKVQAMGLGKMPLIIAADPASPFFEINKCEHRLCESDADCVKVLHTSILGCSKLIGHLNLNFKCGVKQPGCGIEDVACSHSMSINYIKYMSNNGGFPGVPLINSYFSLFLACVSPPNYPNSNTTDCMISNRNILDCDNCPKEKEEFYVFVDENSYYTQKTFKCMMQ